MSYSARPKGGWPSLWSLVWFGTVWYGMIGFGLVWFGTILVKLCYTPNCIVLGPISLLFRVVGSVGVWTLWK